MKRSLSIGVALLLLVIGAWATRRPLHSIYLRNKGLFVSAVAQTLGTTRYLNSSWAHSLLSGFSELGRYQRKNQSLPANSPGRVVFYGDSITDFWPTDDPSSFFPGKPYIGRGVTGQSTDGMLWRFQQDVIDLHPAAVVILAGANDVVLPDRHITFQETTTNLQAMVNLARQHGIRVILCSLLPVSHYAQPQQTVFSKEIVALNHWIQIYAAHQHLTYIDYYSAMADQSGAMNNAFTVDGLHPNAAGYSVMQQLAQQAIDSR
jgi:lysophospholipase L1-like esterase